MVILSPEVLYFFLEIIFELLVVLLEFLSILDWVRPISLLVLQLAG
jgi:hypothetical protein